MEKNKAKVIDTSVRVHDPICLQYLAKKEVVACIPWIVLEELDGLKTRPDIGFDVRQANRTIEEMRNANHPFLKIVQNISWKGDFKRPDEKAKWGEQFAAIRRNDYFRIFPKNLQAFGIRPYSGRDVIDPDTTPLASARGLVSVGQK
jgi:hypothetical protein